MLRNSITKAARWLPVIFASVAITSSIPSNADDGAASIAAGGLVARRETRVVMAKEVLLISEKKIVVDYDFRNDSNEDVTTEIAFPVAPYQFEGPERGISEQSFQSFKLWVDGRVTPYLTQAKADFKGKDVTATLNANRIDIPTFGHWRNWVEKGNEQEEVPDYARLPDAVKKQLAKDGLFYSYGDKTGGGGAWIVHLQYHWTQKFLAHSTVHIRHEYSPVTGYSQLQLEEIEASLARKPPSSEEPSDETLKSFCVDPPMLRDLDAGFKLGQQRQDLKDQTYFVLSRQWVDFILTTANTWRQPIEDFTLIIERPKSTNGEQSLISFCSPGPVTRLDADHFQVHLTNFIPKSELHIGFFAIPEAKAAKAQRKE